MVANGDAAMCPTLAPAARSPGGARAEDSAQWRRRRDAECAVSRMIDDGRPRFERRFCGGGAWTVGGAS